MSLLVGIFVLVLTFFFADSVLTPLLLLLWKKIWLLLLKFQLLLTKKNILQALIQSLVLGAKALLRLINRTLTNWVLPLLLTRRQRYWLQDAMIKVRRTIRWRILRAWVRWRRQPFGVRFLILAPLVGLTIAIFVTSGFFLAALFGVSFIIPWIGGLPIAAVLLLRKWLAKLGLFVFERLGVGAVVNNIVDWMIGLIWWQTPEPVRHRFDAWWRRLKMRMRRHVIGPRRKVTKRMAGMLKNRSSEEE
ncbi:MAG: hypothetical protein ACR2Q4_06980 [Geminicoccaceae bacterium]